MQFYAVFLSLSCYIFNFIHVLLSSFTTMDNELMWVLLSPSDHLSAGRSDLQWDGFIWVMKIHVCVRNTQGLLGIWLLSHCSYRGDRMKFCIKYWFQAAHWLGFIPGRSLEFITCSITLQLGCVCPHDLNRTINIHTSDYSKLTKVIHGTQETTVYF